MRPQRKAGLVLPLWALFAGLPLILMVGHTVFRLFSGDLPSPIALVIPSGRRLPLFVQSVGFALSVALFGTLTALFGAGAIYSTRHRALQWMIHLVLPMTVIPPHIHALAWGGMLRDLNRMLARYGLPGLPEQGFVPSLWVQTMALLPFAFGLLHLGFMTLQEERVNAARLMGPAPRTALRVILPLQAPWLTVAFLFQFLVSLLDDSVPSLFQYNLYPLTIFSEYSIRYDTAHALLLSVPVLAISLPAVRMLLSTLRTLDATGPNRRPFRHPNLRLPVFLQIPLALGLALSLVQVLLPLFSLFVQALPSFRDIRWLTGAFKDLGGTLAVGAMAGVISLPVAWTAADAIHTCRPGHHLWWWLLMLPLSLPAPLIGVGLIYTWNAPALSWTGLYSTLAMPALASAMRFLPFSTLLLISAMKRQPTAALDAARVMQRSAAHGLATIRLPMLRGALLGAGLIAMALSFGELGATLLLLPPGAGSLTIKIYNYLHYGQSDVIAGLCLLLFVVALCLGLALSGLLLPKAHRGESAPPSLPASSSPTRHAHRGTAHRRSE